MSALLQLDRVTIRFGGLTAVNAVDFTGSGRRVATACHDGVLRIFRPGRRDPVRQYHGHEGAVWTVACTNEGPRVATGSDDRTVRLWETAGRFDPVIPAPAGARAAAWSRSSNEAAPRTHRRAFHRGLSRPGGYGAMMRAWSKSKTRQASASTAAICCTPRAVGIGPLSNHCCNSTYPACARSCGCA